MGCLQTVHGGSVDGMGSPWGFRGWSMGGSMGGPRRVRDWPIGCSGCSSMGSPYWVHGESTHVWTPPPPFDILVDRGQRQAFCVPFRT